MTNYKEIEKAIEKLESITELLEKFKHLKEEPGKPFNEVFDEFCQGKNIRRKNWDGRSVSINKFSQFSVESWELSKTDWEVIE